MIGFLLFIRVKDIPKPAPVSPFKHLDERKAAIYENLRDLQFEYRAQQAFGCRITRPPKSNCRRSWRE